MGIACVLGALSVFAAQDVIVKLLSGDYAVFQIVFIRSIVAIVLLGTALHAASGMRGFRTRHPGLLILRASLMFSSYMCYYLAIASLPLADAVSITFSAPLFLTALSVPLLGERVGMHRWLAVLTGFAGVLVMFRPTSGALDMAALLALAAALAYALSSIVTRYIGTRESGLGMAFYAQLVFAVGAIGGSTAIGMLNLSAGSHPSYQFLIRDWAMPTTSDFTFMVATGFIAAIGHTLLAQAFRLAPASTIAPFDYAYFIWAVLFGYLFWGEIPSVAILAGAGIVVASGLYIVRREFVLGKIN